MARTKNPHAAAVKSWETRRKSAGPVQQRNDYKRNQEPSPEPSGSGPRVVVVIPPRPGGLAEAQKKKAAAGTAGWVKAGTAPTGDYSPFGKDWPGAAALKSHEQEHLADEMEFGAAFSETGEVLFKQQGNANSVHFSKEQRSKMKGAVVTHNHPSHERADENGKTFRYSTGFSDEDIIMAVVHEMKEIRCTNPDGTVYRFGTINGWNPKDTEHGAWAKHIIRQELPREVLKFQRRATKRRLKKIRSGRLTVAQANRELAEWRHKLLVRLARKYEKYGVYYKRTKGGK
jgi:hypothetical protein